MTNVQEIGLLNCTHSYKNIQNMEVIIRRAAHIAMKESSLQIHDEKDIKSPLSACNYLLSSQELMMWCEFRMFSHVLTECCLWM